MWNAPSAKPRLIFAIRCALGLLVLLPAFLMWMQFAILDNVARSKGLEGNWHALAIPLATIGYLIAFGIWAFTQRRSLAGDGYLIAYCAYIASLFAFASSGNFFHQLHLHGAITAFANHVEGFVYLAPAIIFLLDRVVLAFDAAVRREQLRVTRNSHKGGDR